MKPKKQINKSIVNSLLLFSLAVPGYAVVSDEQVASLKEMSERKVAKLEESLNLLTSSDRMEVINEAIDYIVFYDITHSDNANQALSMPYNLVMSKGWNSHNYEGKRIGTLDSQVLMDLTVPERELRPLLNKEFLEQEWELFFDSISNHEIGQAFFSLEREMGRYLAEIFLEAQMHKSACILPTVNIPNPSQKIILCDDEGCPIKESFKAWFRSLYDRFDRTNDWNFLVQSLVESSNRLQIIEILRGESEGNPNMVNFCSTLQEEVAKYDAIRTERARARAIRTE
jgi:hypothetical protein